MEMMNNVHDQMQKTMSGVLSQIDEMQPNPIGTTQRSAKERSQMWQQFMVMDPETRQNTFRVLAPIMKHDGPDFDDCSLCEFIKENTGASTLNGINTEEEPTEQQPNNANGYEGINRGP